MDRIEFFITDYESTGPLERFVFVLRLPHPTSLENQTHPIEPPFGMEGLATQQIEAIEADLSKLYLPILLSEPLYPSKGAKYNIHMHSYIQTPEMMISPLTSSNSPTTPPVTTALTTPTTPATSTTTNRVFIEKDYTPLLDPNIQQLGEVENQWFILSLYIETPKPTT